MVFSKNKRYFEGSNGKYRLDFQNSGLHLSHGNILLELQNKGKHCIVNVWVCLYTLCYKFLLIQNEESIQLTVRLFWSGKKVHKEIKYFINLNTVTCCFFQSSAFFGLMEDRKSFSTASIIYQCTHSKLMFFKQLLFLV